MSQLFAVGRLTGDLVLKWSEKSKRYYVYFTIFENRGYWNSPQYRYIQVWAWGTDAARLVQSGLAKNNRIWVTGSAELVDYVSSDGIKTNGLKLCLKNWGFASERYPKHPFTVSAPIPEPIQHNPAPVTVICGDKDILPE